MLEKQIETAVCQYAKDKGLLVYKFTSPNRAAVPDRLMVLPSGHIFFVEFKREGKKPTPAQAREHAKLSGHNVKVFIVDHIEHGKFIIDAVCAGLRL